MALREALAAGGAGCGGPGLQRHLQRRRGRGHPAVAGLQGQGPGFPAAAGTRCAVVAGGGWCRSRRPAPAGGCSSWQVGCAAMARHGRQLWALALGTEHHCCAPLLLPIAGGTRQAPRGWRDGVLRQRQRHRAFCGAWCAANRPPAARTRALAQAVALMAPLFSFATLGRRARLRGGQRAPGAAHLGGRQHARPHLHGHGGWPRWHLRGAAPLQVRHRCHRCLWCLPAAGSSLLPRLGNTAARHAHRCPLRPASLPPRYPTPLQLPAVQGRHRAPPPGGGGLPGILGGLGQWLLPPRH